MEKIKIAQIGVCHEHANGKIDALLRRPDVFELVGYVDERSFSATPRMPEPYQIELYAGLRQLSLDEALNWPGLEAATVEVPNNELVPIALKCMEKGLAMHMDKPAGEDLALFRRLLDGCAAKGLPFQMGFMFRGNPAFQFAIRAVREKVLGEVFAIDADMNHDYGGEDYQCYLAGFPGGIMYNLGCHLIDFVVAAMGRPVAVTPFLRSAPGCPDACKNNCLAVLEYPHAFVTLRACSQDPATTMGRRLRITGDNGNLTFSPLERFDGQPVEIALRLAHDAGGFPAGDHVLRFPPQKNRYETQLLEFAEAVRGQRPLAYSYEHDYLVHAVTLAAAGYTKWS